MGDNLYRTTGEFIPDKLIAGNRIPVTTKGIVVSAGQGLLKRGTVLGISASGTYRVTGSKDIPGGDSQAGAEASGEKMETSAEEDFTEAASAETVGCDCILADAVDTTEGDAVAAAYVTGEFNRDALSSAEGAELCNYETELRRLGIFIKSVQEYE